MWMDDLNIRSNHLIFYHVCTEKITEVVLSPSGIFIVSSVQLMSLKQHSVQMLCSFQSAIYKIADSV